MSGTASSAAWVGVEQLAAATSSSSVRSVWWPIEAITGTGEQRDRAAQHLVAEREQVGRRAAAAGDDDHVDRRRWRRGRAAPRAIRGAAWRSCTGANAQTSRPAQPRRASAGDEVLARLAGLGADDADRARQQHARQRALAVEQAVGGERAAAPLDLREQVALAGDRAAPMTAKLNAGDALALPG